MLFLKVTSVLFICHDPFSGPMDKIPKLITIGQWYLQSCEDYVPRSVFRSIANLLSKAWKTLYAGVVGVTGSAKILLWEHTLHKFHAFVFQCNARLCVCFLSRRFFHVGQRPHFFSTGFFAILHWFWGHEMRNVLLPTTMTSSRNCLHFRWPPSHHSASKNAPERHESQSAGKSK